MNMIQNIIDNRFNKWRDIMAKVLSDNGWYMTVDDVYKDCMECRRLLFENGEAFVVVNVIENPNDTRLFILLAGGSMAGLDKLDPIVYKFGQSIGATKCGMIGRKGFMRRLKNRGWKAPSVYMEKEIYSG